MDKVWHGNCNVCSLSYKEVYIVAIIWLVYSQKKEITDVENVPKR
jgi:hypothetical protein